MSQYRSKSSSNQRKLSSRRNHITGGNQKKLEKDKGQAWKDNSIVYIEERIYILNNQKI